MSCFAVPNGSQIRRSDEIALCRLQGFSGFGNLVQAARPSHVIPRDGLRGGGRSDCVIRVVGEEKGGLSSYRYG
jgi:hypothetical protein